MKVWMIRIILLCLGYGIQYGKIDTGFFLSLGAPHTQARAYESGQILGLDGERNDLFVGLTINLNQQWEINLVYNRSTEDFGGNTDVISFDKDGIALEAGKLISVDFIKKAHFSTALQFSAGPYITLFPFKKANVSREAVYSILGPEIYDKLFYNYGIYWSVRLRYLIGNKFSILLGYKSQIPVRSNEYSDSRGQEILLRKSFLYLGVSF